MTGDPMPPEIALASAIAEFVRSEVDRKVAAALAERSAAADLVTVDEYARQRSISVSTVRAAIRDGRLAATRIGRAVRVPATAAIARPANDADVARDARRARLLGGR